MNASLVNLIITIQTNWSQCCGRWKIQTKLNYNVTNSIQFAVKWNWLCDNIHYDLLNNADVLLNVRWKLKESPPIQCKSLRRQGEMSVETESEWDVRANERVKKNETQLKKTHRHWPVTYSVLLLTQRKLRFNPENLPSNLWNEWSHYK